MLVKECLKRTAEAYREQVTETSSSQVPGETSQEATDIWVFTYTEHTTQRKLPVKYIEN